MRRDGDGQFGRRVDSSEPTFAKAMAGNARSESGPSSVAQSKEKSSADAQAAFCARKPHFTLQDIVLMEDTRRSIQRLTQSIRNYDELSNWAPRVFAKERRYLAVNFYGPPGTGKTMCAEALAAEFGRLLLEINYAELESELWGKSSKNIQLAFRRAREQEAVLFFDEADSVLGSRIKDPGQSSDQHVNMSRSVLLKELDHFSGIVIFATNLAKNYDRAFVRRIYQHIEVPLPDETGRRSIWKLLLADTVPGYEDIDFDAIAAASDGLAGGDIANVIRQALPDVHEREADRRRLLSSDLVKAIEDVRRSKQDVGG